MEEHSSNGALTLDERYLRLMRMALTRYGLEVPVRYTIYRTHRRGLDGHIRLGLQRLVRRYGLDLVEPRPSEAEDREFGRDWPETAETMIGLRRLDNLRACVEDVLARDVPGDFIETGVWRGGASIYVRAILAARGVRDRTVWLADSFEGLPPPNVALYPQDAGSGLWRQDALRVSVEDVKENFRKYGLLDDQVRFLEGWFKNTLPNAPVEQLAVLRLDGDMYESTIQALDALYAKVSPGGYVIVDDYGAVTGCKQAVDDFRRTHGLREEIVTIDWAGVFWQRST